MAEQPYMQPYDDIIRNIPGPQQTFLPLYMPKRTRLWFLCVNTVAGAAIGYRGMILRLNGEVQRFEEQLIPSAIGQQSNMVYEAGEGWLLNVSVHANTSGILPGQCYARVLMAYPFQSSQTVYNSLIQAYVSELFVPTWPFGAQHMTTEGPGAVVLTTGTDPAAGAEISVATGANLRQRLIAARFTLVTAAGGVDRRVHLIIDDGTDIILDIAANDLQAAGITRNYNCAIDGHQRTAVAPEVYIPLPDGIELTYLYRVRTATDNLAAGDNFGAPLLYYRQLLNY